MLAGMKRFHAGREIVNPRKLRILASSIHRTGKPQLIQIMRDLESGLTVREASKAYDRVTAAINGWIVAVTKDLSKDLHVKLLITNCFSVNCAWFKGKPGVYPDYPKLWIQVGDRRGKPGPRSQIRRMRMREWSKFKTVQPLDSEQDRT